MSEHDKASHPEELLAEYVDGLLDDARRTEVEAHLGGCPSCRAEVAAGHQARMALSGLREVPVPMGTTRQVVEQARGRTGSKAVRILAGAGMAAAAALVALFLWVGGGGDSRLPGMGDDGDQELSQPTAPEDTSAGGAGSDIRVDRTGRNFSAETVRFLAADIAEEEAPMAAESADATPTPSPTSSGNVFASGPAPSSASMSPPRYRRVRDPAVASRALSCIGRQVDESQTGAPIRIIDALFEQQRAWFGAYLIGKPPKTLDLYVVAKQDCRLLTYAQQRL